MKKEHRLRVLENGVQRKTFGAKRHEVTRSFMIGTPSLFILVIRSRGMGLAGHAACRGDEERCI